MRILFAFVPSNTKKKKDLVYHPKHFSLLPSIFFFYIIITFFHSNSEKVSRTLIIYWQYNTRLKSFDLLNERTINIHAYRHIQTIRILSVTTISFSSIVFFFFFFVVLYFTLTEAGFDRKLNIITDVKKFIQNFLERFIWYQIG